jgi:hypothetical protein
MPAMYRMTHKIFRLSQVICVNGFYNRVYSAVRTESLYNRATFRLSRFNERHRHQRPYPFVIPAPCFTTLSAHNTSRPINYVFNWTPYYCVMFLVRCVFESTLLGLWKWTNVLGALIKFKGHCRGSDQSRAWGNRGNFDSFLSMSPWILNSY